MQNRRIQKSVITAKTVETVKTVKTMETRLRSMWTE